MRRSEERAEARALERMRSGTKHPIARIAMWSIAGLLAAGSAGAHREVAKLGTAALTSRAAVGTGRLALDPEALVNEAPASDPLLAHIDAGPTQLFEPFFPFLSTEDSATSVSVGGSSHGHLVNGREVKIGESIDILPRQRKRNLAYGTHALVGMLEDAGKTLYAETKTKLWLGNIAQRGGGDIPWSVSHNSGRDADVAFCYQNAQGKPIDPPDLVPLNAEGLSTDRKLRFDTPRTWLVVKSLLLSQRAQVQYLFISQPLKRKLMTHARVQGEPQFLLDRAIVALRQPGAALAHNDHLHVRIYCGERDVTGGCEDQGAIHPWHAPTDPTRSAFIESTLHALSAELPTDRRNAALRLAMLRAPDAGEALAKNLHDGDPWVRAATAQAISELRASTQDDALIQQFYQESHPLVRLAQVRALGGLGTERAGQLIARLVSDPTLGIGDAISLNAPLLSPFSRGRQDVAASLRPQLFAPIPASDHPPQLLEEALASPEQWWSSKGRFETLRITAAKAAGFTDQPAPVAALLALAASTPSDDTRSVALQSLRQITNHDISVDGSDRADDERAIERWYQLYAQLRPYPRHDWVIRGFVAAGYDVRLLDRRYSWELVRAIGGPPYLSDNAQRILSDLAGEAPESLNWSRSDACRYWLLRIQELREQWKLGKPPPKTRQACQTLRREAKGDEAG